MAEPVTINLRHVARGLSIPLRQVEVVVELLDEGNTVPFITRYRKDQTGGLDEEHVRQIQARLKKMRLLAERKQTILRSIESQGKLTEALASQIHGAGTAKRLEDLYLPFKPKKQTLATLARSRGLEPLAREILDAVVGSPELDARAADFVSVDRRVPTAADALLGAGHILAEQFSEHAELRERLRDIIQRTGRLVCSRVGPEPKGADEKGEGEKSGKGEKSEKGEKGGAPVAESVGDQPSPVADFLSDPPVDVGSNPSPLPPPNGDGTTGEPPAQPLHTLQTLQTLHTLRPEDEGTAAVAPVLSPPSAEDAGASPHPSPLPVGEGTTRRSPKQPSQRSAAQQKRDRKDKKEQKKKKADERRQRAFADYYTYSEEIKRIPPHRVLAINRGERARVLRVRLECDMEAMNQAVDELCVPAGHPHADFLRGCARDALTRLILPSLEREIRRELTERAETHAVTVFARNLRNLFLQPPVRDRRVLAVDPGYKSGCKLAALDQFGNVLGHDLIYLVGKPERRDEARRIVGEMVEKHGLGVVAIGNGTACRDSEDLIGEMLGQELKDKGVAYVIVNEAGASVYSTSRLGREEFPQYDAVLRGAVSIGRRLQDPLSELVKIEPANLGVGLYQHDVKAKHLQESLDEVVESCVNYVGVDVNTASPALLRYVSGLNQLTARRLYEYRLEHGPFRSRQQLKEVPGFGEATFVQAAGFFKIEGDNPLDATWIHPESYEIAGKVLARLDGTPADLAVKETAAARAERLSKIEVDALAKDLEVGTMLLRDIIAQLTRPGRDPREDLPPPIFKRGVLKLEDLTPAMELTGTVLNVVDFGAFVDIGMHDSGLVHVSHMADRFIHDPHEVISVGDIVKVWVLEVDKQRRRVSLTMIPPGHARMSGRRHGKPEESGQPAEPGEPGGSRRPEGRSRSQGRPRPEGQARPEGQSRPEGQARPEGEASGGPPRRSDRPRFERRPPPSGQGPRREYGPPKPPFKPRPKPRPITPITDEMKIGKEPLRSFGDLMQFYEIEHPGPAQDPAKDKPQPPKSQGPQGKQRRQEPKGPLPPAAPPSPASPHPGPLPEGEGTSAAPPMPASPHPSPLPEGEGKPVEPSPAPDSSPPAPLPSPPDDRLPKAPGEGD